MLLAHLVETSRRVSESSRRLDKVDLLAGLLNQVKPEESETVVAFLSGNTRQGRIGVGYASIRQSAAPAAEIPVLEILDVDRTLESLATVQGPGAERQRREILHGLLSRATPEEQHFLTRLLLGELRQGALEGVMLDALAKASGVRADRVRRAAMMAGSAQAIASALLEKGEAGLEQYDIQLFRPVQPMLAQTADDVSSALADLGESALEFKFDGARVQVHKSGDTVLAFSRRLNDVTAAVPEVMEAVRALPARDLILDGEVLSLDPDDRPRPFQITMRRFGRKLDVDPHASRTSAFAVLVRSVVSKWRPSLIDETQARRFGALSEMAAAEALVPHMTTADAGHAEDFLHQALSRGHEGIMAKDLNAGYAAGARGQGWLKVKQARSLDLVILAAEWGNGRRQGWLSNLHLGARDTEKGGFAMLGKTFKGLTDEMLVWQTEQLLKIEIARDNYTVHVQPKLVAEIAFNEIQISPRYASGLALRFARVKRYRPDKSANDSDTFETVRKLAGL